MQRIANGTQVASLPTPAAPVGAPGYGTNGDPGAGLLGSIFGADEFNRLQEELMAFLTAASIAPDGANNGQVLAAARLLFGGGGVLGATGWQYLPDRLLIQWGSGSTSSGGVAITFPVSFGNNSYSVILSEAASNSWGGSDVTVYGRQAVGALPGSMFVNSRTWNGTTFVPSTSAFFNWFALGDA